jgi:putative heme-binding domain-containing protein
MLLLFLAAGNPAPRESVQTPAANQRVALPALPPPASVLKPGASTDGPYAPLPILQGGVVIPLYPPGSPFLKSDRVREPEQYNMSQTVPGRINSIVNIHNPSIEIHRVESNLNTGSAVILIAGGGHKTLNVGSESADLVPFFYNYGVNTIILRNRLRRDGYNPQTDAVNDVLQAIRMVRAYAGEWSIDPKRIGVMGFSAGAELAASAAVLFPAFNKANNGNNDPLRGISSRPDFAGLIYPGPSPFARDRTPPLIPPNVAPAFLVCGGPGDQIHAVWTLEYFRAMLDIGVPNTEMHIYGNGRHPGDALPDGTRMTGGLTDRNNTPFGTWQYRFIDWFRDLGFLQAPGVVTKAAKDVASFADQPTRGDRKVQANPASGNPAAIGEGESLFRANCSPCHGFRARGGGRGPDLTMGTFVHGGQDGDLFRTISQGVDGTDMPGSAFEESETWALVAYIRSLGSSSRAVVRGNRVAGEQIFLKKGCSKCHMVSGEGGRLGPELTRVGSARSIEYLTQAIRKPDEDLTIIPIDPNNHYAFPVEWDTVTVVTSDGTKITGTAKNEDEFSIQLFGEDERLHLLLKKDLRDVRHQRRSLMPAYTEQMLNASELQDLLSFLNGLQGGDK